MKIIGIIPARYASSRFPGKPLVDIFGKSMIQRVYEQSNKAFEYVAVATDDQRIYDAVTAFGGKAVMTSVDHKSGTDRCAEAVKKIEIETGLKFDVTVNIQGDEPFIRPEELRKVAECFRNPIIQIATLVKPTTDIDTIFSPNSPKVVLNKNNEALYFSRSPIPYLRNFDTKDWGKNHIFYKHIGIYAFKTDVLSELTCLMPSTLETAESLEQNRWLENGYRIKTEISEYETIAIDTPDDLNRVLSNKNILNQM